MTTLPDNWALVRIADIAEHNLGKMLDRSKHTTGNELPYLRNINVQWFRIDTDDLSTMFFRDSELARYTVKDGDLLICEGGEPGRCAIWDGRLTGIMYQKALHRLRPPSDISSEYIAYHLRHDASRGKLDEYFTGTTIKHFTGRALAKYEVRLPPRQEQRRIVAKIESLFDRSRRAKQALDAIPPLLDKLRQSILAAAFRGDLTADWRAQNPNVESAHKVLERICTERRHRWEQTELAKMRAKGKEPKDDKWKTKYKEPALGDISDLPELPDGWAWSSVGNLVEVQTGSTPKRGNPVFYDGGTIPWVTSTVVNHEYVEAADQFVTDTALEKTNLKLFPPGTVLVAMYGEGKTRGKCTELRISSTTNQALAALRTDLVEASLKEFLKLSLEHNYQRIRLEAGGGVQPNLNLTDVRNILVPIPPSDEQAVIFEEVAKQTSQLAKIRDALKGQAEKAKMLDQAILAKAFRGELVEQDPDDEPASVLLERIRAAREAAQPVKKTKAKPKRRVGGKKNAEIPG